MNKPWYKVEELAPGIQAVVDRDGGWFLSNSLVYCRDGVLVVIDTQYNPKRAGDLLLIAREQGCLPPAYTVITHHHGDHAWGTKALSPSEIIMAEKSWQAALQIRELVPDLYKPVFPWLDFTGSEYMEPSKVFTGELNADLEGITLVLEEYGPAHTVSDTVVFIPEHGIAVVGDLAFNRVVPFALDGTVKGWLETIDKLRGRLEGYRILPGHGDPGGVEILEATGRYLEWIMDVAERFYGRGVRDPLEAYRNLEVPREFRGWRHQERHAFNLERAFMDLEGVPAGVPTSRLMELAQLIRK